MTARFANPEIAFEVPNDWRDGSNTRYVLPGAESSITLAAHTSPETTVNQHAFALLEHLRATAPGFRLVNQADFPLGNEPAFRFVFDWERDGKPHRNFVRLVVRDGVLWSLTAITTLADLPKTGPAIKIAMESFGLPGAPTARTESPAPIDG